MVGTKKKTGTVLWKSKFPYQKRQILWTAKVGNCLVPQHGGAPWADNTGVHSNVSKFEIVPKLPLQWQRLFGDPPTAVLAHSAHNVATPTALLSGTFAQMRDVTVSQACNTACCRTVRFTAGGVDIGLRPRNPQSPITGRRLCDIGRYLHMPTVVSRSHTEPSNEMPCHSQARWRIGR